jgi:hypothetical protein
MRINGFDVFFVGIGCGAAIMAVAILVLGRVTTGAW